MADAEDNDGESAESSPPAKGGVLPYIIVGILCTAGGLAVPLLIPAKATTGDTAEQVKPPYELPSPEDTKFVSFGAVSVNLDEGRLSRYLQVSITLQVAKDQELELTKMLETQKAPLTSWLIAHLSDKTLDEVRGAAGQNRLRREIRDQFNTILYPDGYDRIYDVLFDNYAIQ
ncbi:MAG: flagellar basal body-associated FliL family protein [Planctomycetaceae bacterium]